MLKLLVELGPIIVFFATYKYSNIFIATMIMLLVTVSGLIVSYIIDKKISIPLLVSGVVLLTTGSITLISKNPDFIKMKPTIVYLVFAGILLYGYLKKQGYMRHVFSAALKLEEEIWVKLSLRFSMFFFFLAILNEGIWRRYPEEFWVNFKVFGFGPIIFIFVALQIPYIYKNQTRD
jgi:intracellular septation protein